MSGADATYGMFPRPVNAEAPLVLSEEAFVAHVRPSDPRISLSGEELRALKLVALVIYAQAVRLSRGGTVAVHAVTVPTAVPVLAEIGGLSIDSASRAIERLVRCGVLRMEHGGYRIAEQVLVPNPGVAVIRWDRVLDQISGNAAALLAAWALGQILSPPWEEREVPLQKVERLTAYSRNRARTGINHLVDGGIVLRRDTIGGAPLYRFSNYAVGRSDTPPERRSSSAAAPGATDPASRASPKTVAAAPVAETAPTLRMELAGHPITLDPRVPIEVRIDEQGREVYRIGTHLRIIIDPLANDTLA